MGRPTQRKHLIATDLRLRRHGIESFTAEEIATLHRCEQALHTWAEHECNGVIQREDEDGTPYRYDKDEWGSPTIRRPKPCVDSEAKALEAVRALCEPRGLHFHHQTDPRGCALYIARAEERMDATNYSSVGVGIFRED